MLSLPSFHEKYSAFCLAQMNAKHISIVAIVALAARVGELNVHSNSTDSIMFNDWEENLFGKKSDLNLIRISFR